MKLALISFVVGWFVLIGAFVIAMHVKRLRDEGVLVSLFWRANLWPLVACGVTLDIAFNVVAGSLMYLELPHEFMFTNRCKRWVAVSDDETSELWLYRRTVARWWQRQLNQIDPGHV